MGKDVVSAVLQPAPSKLCRVCGKGFLPFQSTQIVCGVSCARRIPVIQRKEAKADRLKTRARIDELRPLSYWVKQAQGAFNAWIRQRDAGKPCISCQRPAGQFSDAGHYLTIGARPELRFDEANVHRQCIPCNQHLHGNLIRYRLGLIARVGQAEVDRLEGPHAPRLLRADDLKRIRDDYRARLKAEQPAEVF